MRYISTRGLAPGVDFTGALMTGLAPDGGLYVPQSWPQLPPGDLAVLAGQPYAQAAAALMLPYISGEIVGEELQALLGDAYAGFRHKAIAPLVQIDDNLFVLELFHGPTLAFKDFAMQVLSRLMERELRRSGGRITVIGATSGDTGAAAIEAFKDRAGIQVFILYPHRRVSDVQRRQMTTPAAASANVHVLAVEGTFDDCQGIVKTLFNDAPFRSSHQLCAVNSINWARIMAQIPYYITAAAVLGAPSRQISFTVPTGNFGDIFAGYAAKRMGLPVERLVIATNANDILARALATGCYQPRGVVATESPSMDIQISSNFERLLFEASGRHAERVRELMQALKTAGEFSLSGTELSAIRADFSAYSAGESEARQALAGTHAHSGYLADPHTAVGIAAARKAAAEGRGTPMVVLATAHPAKFPQAVKAAVNAGPELPAALRHMMSAPEQFSVLANDAGAVAAFIAEHSAGQRKRHIA